MTELLRELDVELLAGGPPCQPFSRAGASKIRSLVQSGVRPEHDDRRDLWQAFLEIVVSVHPRAVLLENVPDMAIAADTTIVRTLVSELEAAGYAVHTALLRSCDYGVPQIRQRFFLVALAERAGFSWPSPSDTEVTVDDAIADLPPVEGGWRPPAAAEGFLPYAAPRNPGQFVRRARQGLEAADRSRIYDHITRPVRADDRVIFESMNSTTRYADIDPSLRRYRHDIFDDKYKRLDWKRPSRSITAHIARDGYWYIHPDQARTLTLREAARLQTFPDRVRFAGPPSAAFRQIGNAVPPLLAERVALSIRDALDRPQQAPAASIDVSSRLVRWFEHKRHLTLPWLKAQTAWTALQGHLLLDRAPTNSVEVAWPTIEKLKSPERTIESADLLRGPSEHHRQTKARRANPQRGTLDFPASGGHDVVQGPPRNSGCNASRSRGCGPSRSKDGTNSSGGEPGDPQGGIPRLGPATADPQPRKQRTPRRDTAAGRVESQGQRQLKGHHGCGPRTVNKPLHCEQPVLLAVPAEWSM